VRGTENAPTKKVQENEKKFLTNLSKCAIIKAQRGREKPHRPSKKVQENQKKLLTKPTRCDIIRT